MLSVNASNKMLEKRMLLVWLGAVLLYFLAVVDFWGVESVARQISSFVPMVQGLFEKGTPMGNVAGRYFGLAVLFVPVAAVFFVWQQDLLARAKIGLRRTGSIWKYVLIMYFLGVPLCAFILALMYFAPFELPTDPRLSGQIIAHAMINTYPGLLTFGSVAILSAALFLFMMLASFLTPFLALASWYKGV